jgi:hypothetical protein
MLMQSPLHKRELNVREMLGHDLQAQIKMLEVTLGPNMFVSLNNPASCQVTND